MRRRTVGFAVLALAVCGVGGLVSPAGAEGVSRCTLSFNIDLVPRPAVAGTVQTNGTDPRPPVVDCRGRPAGPWAGLDPARLIPDFDIDVDVAT